MASRRARKIIKDFCSSESVMEINIDEKLKRRLAESLVQPNVSVVLFVGGFSPTPVAGIHVRCRLGDCGQVRIFSSAL
jgi:hypothetical protein